MFEVPSQEKCETGPSQKAIDGTDKPILKTA